jgi:hypothetical protein
MMKEVTGILILGMLLLFSCKKNNDTKIVLDGTYTGTFTRVGLVLKEPTPVKISFAEKEFSGESGQLHHPDVCHGVYEITGGSVNIENACLHTADFDWSLIFNGKYKISSDGDELTISRMYVGFVVYSDTYRLKKQ